MSDQPAPESAVTSAAPEPAPAPAPKPAAKKATNKGIKAGWAGIIITLSLLWAIILVLNLIPQLRGDYGWRWPYAVPHDVARVWPFATSLGLYLLGARWFLRKARARSLTVWAMLGSVALTLTGLYAAYDPFYQLYSITIGVVAGGWHYAASHIADLGATLRIWPAYMAEAAHTVSSHLGIAPPGAVVAYATANKFFAYVPSLANALGRPLRALQCHQFALLNYTNAEFASVWLGILTPLWASLAILPIYYFGRRIYGDLAARWSIIWWPLVPGFLMFTPTPYTLYPLFSVIIIGLTIEGLRHDRPVWLWLAGLITSAMTFLTFAFSPLLLMAGLLALGIYWTQSPKLSWHWPFRMGLWFGAGLATVWVVYYALTGVTIWAIFQQARVAHLALGRPYWPWLILHLNDVFMFTGWPLSLLAGLGLWRALRSVRTNRSLAIGDLLIGSMFIALIAIDLAGVLRGETGRILLFLSPFILFAAADTFATSANATRVGWSITLAQAVMAFVMVLFLRVISSEFYTPPPAAPPTVQPPTDTGFPSGAVFANALQLESFAGHVATHPDATGRPQRVLELWLDWQSTGQVDVPYYLSLIPVAPGGQAAPAAELKQPFDGAYPTTCWLPSSGPIQVQVEVPLFSAQPQGDWWVSLALIDGQTGNKAAVGLPNGLSDDQVGLGPFTSQ